MERVRVAMLVAAVAAAAAPVPVRSDPAPTISRPFEVEAASQPIYGIQAPAADPTTQRHTLLAADGTALVIETWLPAAKDGHVPPDRIPTIVSISPYLDTGVVESNFLLETMVPRGYAYANAHVRGTGESGGCMDLFGAIEVDDSARVIEYLGRDAPWRDGHVGGYGVSYPGGTILSVAGRGDPSRAHYLEAIVAGAPYHSMHEAQWTFDGVPSFLIPATTPTSYVAESFGLTPDDPPNPPLDERLPQRAGCAGEHLANGLDWSGDHTAWHRQRDNRAWTSDIRAATLITHGHADLVPNGGSPPSIEVGLFDQLPDTTPHAGIFGVFGHRLPPRDDITDIVVAWFDRWLRGVDAGLDSWPAVQVQGTDGQWRAEPDWPDTGGPPGQLALGPDGRLGAAAPTGSTAYVDAGYETTVDGAEHVPGTVAVFETGPLPDRLELTGQPVLDLWVTLAAPDAHIAARIETYAAAGEPIANGLTYGLRSAQHLQPFDEGRFVQARGVPAPVGVPINVPVRFQPTDLVVPAGGALRLTIAGSLIVNPGLAQLGVPEPVFLGPSQPAFVPNAVTIHHDCAHTSVLRFLQPDARPDLLHIRQGDVRPGPPRPVPAPVSDGGGITTAAVCGEGPIEPTR